MVRKGGRIDCDIVTVCKLRNGDERGRDAMEWGRYVRLGDEVDDYDIDCLPDAEKDSHQPLLE